MAVHIRLKQFDGPLDLLLHLIGKAKIDLKDVFVSEITEQYIEAVQSAPDFDMDEASEFVAMAALLVEIKSRALLPKPPKTDDEEDPEHEGVQPAPDGGDRELGVQHVAPHADGRGGRQEDEREHLRDDEVER